MENEMDENENIQINNDWLFRHRCRTGYVFYFRINEWHPDDTYMDENGICRCRDCHKMWPITKVSLKSPQ